MLHPAKFFWVGGIIVLLAGGTAWAYPRVSRYAAERDRVEVVASLPPATLFTKPTSTNPKSITSPKNFLPTQGVAPPVARAVNLKVPFTAQAPFQVWDLAHNEACEEASVAMVNAFYKSTTFTPASAEDEILKLENWEVNRFGYFEDTNAEETAIILREFYGYADVRVQYDFTAEDIRAELRKDHPVIIPAAGRQLGNPNFRGAGPRYHMIVIKGYTQGKFVTNDPGTRHGADYVYSEAVIMRAAHDYNNGEVPSGRKVMIVAYPSL